MYPRNEAVDEVVHAEDVGLGDPKGFRQNLRHNIVLLKLTLLVLADIFGNP